ncbi:MAG: hypothetical protein M3Y13_06870 [Armatimonadota bacterium]|nr:hypothetical protein [Armatimonadota bacterium]
MPLLNTLLELHFPPTLNQPLLMLNQEALADLVYGGRLTGPHWKQLANTFLAKGDAASDIQKELIYQVYGMGDAAPPAWKQLADYQRGRVWPNTLPALPHEQGQPFQTVISRAAQTDWLGEQGKMEYVSDYYSHGGYEMPPDQKKLPVKRPLAAELDEMAAKRDISWKRNADGLVLIRNNRWYRDDGLEVPQPLLRRWFALLLQSRQQEAAAQAATPPMPQTAEERMAAIKQTWDWAAEVSSTLTPWQIHNGLTLFQPEEKDLMPQNDASAAKLFEPIKHQKQLGKMPPEFDFFVYMTRQPPFSDATSLSKYFSHTVHLYGGLDDVGRAALLAGRLPASALSPSQVMEAVPLLPLLPQVLQNYPPEAVLLRLPCLPSDATRIEFGTAATSGLEIVPPPPDAPQNAP